MLYLWMRRVVWKQGAGTTIYRHIHDIHNRTMYHLHTVAVNEIIHVAQYDSEMLVSVINPDNDELIAEKTVVMGEEYQNRSVFR